MQQLIQSRVHKYYWDEDLNCATAMLKILGEIFAVEIHPQVIAAAVGMHGAGKYGAQCGLVEGSLMFIGLYGGQLGLKTESIVALCNDFAGRFEKRFFSLRCKELRPQGFRPEDPPHLCEGKSRIAVHFAADFVASEMKPINE